MGKGQKIFNLKNLNHLLSVFSWQFKLRTFLLYSHLFFDFNTNTSGINLSLGFSCSLFSNIEIMSRDGREQHLQFFRVFFLFLREWHLFPFNFIIILGKNSFASTTCLKKEHLRGDETLSHLRGWTKKKTFKIQSSLSSSRKGTEIVSPSSVCCVFRKS